MWKILEKSALGKAVKFAKLVAQMRISVYAANACYFLVLAVFPMLVLLLGMVRYAGLSVQTLLAVLEDVVPEALMPAAQKLVVSAYRNTTGTVLSLSALTALWSASRGIYGLLTGLNAVYGAKEDRGYLYTRSVSMLYTFGFLLVLVLTLVLQLFGAAIAVAIPNMERVIDLRFLVLLLTQTVLFMAMYTVLPNRKNKFTHSFPGAVLASVGWLVFSDLYSAYVEHFHSYANIYGSVYAVALSMLWLYCCIWIVFCGGALNRYWIDTNAI